MAYHHTKLFEHLCTIEPELKHPTHSFTNKDAHRLATKSGKDKKHVIRAIVYRLWTRSFYLNRMTDPAFEPDAVKRFSATIDLARRRHAKLHQTPKVAPIKSKSGVCKAKPVQPRTVLLSQLNLQRYKFL